MSSIVFRHTKVQFISGANGPNPASGVIYVGLATAAPTNVLITARSQLTESTGGNYAPVVVLNSGDARTFTTTANGVFWTFGNPTWTGLTTNGTAVTGMYIARQAGGSPATSDLVFCYNHLSGSAYTPNGANFSIIAPASGWIEIP